MKKVSGLEKRMDGLEGKKVVDLLKRHGIGTVEELAFLEGLAKGA